MKSIWWPVVTKETWEQPLLLLGACSFLIHLLDLCLLSAVQPCPLIKPISEAELRCCYPAFWLCRVLTPPLHCNPIELITAPALNKNKKVCAYILLASFSCSALCFTTWKMNLPRSHSFPLIPECSRTVISSTWKADSSVKLYWQALEPGQSCSCLAKWKFDTLTANKIHKLNNKKRWRGSTSKLTFLIC